MNLLSVSLIQIKITTIPKSNSELSKQNDIANFQEKYYYEKTTSKTKWFP